MIVDSLHEVGAARSIVIDEDDVILAGNGTVEAAGEAGIERVRVIEADGEEIIAVRRRGLTKPQKRRLSLFDNRTAELADWDAEALLQSTKDGISLDGIFTEQEAEKLLRDVLPPSVDDPGAQIDRATELQAKWKTERGQVWQVGRHRLMCGDSTKAENAARVMGNEKINVCVTDPPYGMGLDTDWSGIRGTGRSLGFQKSVRGKAYAPVHGDDKPFDPQPLFDLWGHEVAEMFLFGADYYAERIPNRSNGSWLVWDKRKESQADGFGSEFELIWSRSKHKRRILRHEWFGFLREGEHGESRTHPTQKPVALIADLLLQWSSPDSLVSDPYLGSGTTMVAAEQLGRICYGMEIEPKYVAVSLERMAGMGLEPKLVT